jgi:hypothetical protein
MLEHSSTGFHHHPPCTKHSKNHLHISNQATYLAKSGAPATIAGRQYSPLVFISVPSMADIGTKSSQWVSSI